MDRRSFLKLLSKQLYPMLRAEGFNGSGITLRRIDGALVHVVNIQGDKSGTECHFNLGVHLMFLPAEGGFDTTAESIEEVECVFRGRVYPPSGRHTGWSYGQSLHEAELVIETMVGEWESQGHALLPAIRDLSGQLHSTLAGH